MHVIVDAADLRATLSELRRTGRSIGFVPTMGYLHEGHLRLVTEARAAGDVVVMSIFVNPTQFGSSEDLERYPRDLERDRMLARDGGVDVLFVPEMATMYPDGPERQSVWVEPGELGTVLEGSSRPGHFRGVATIVCKLFNLVQPDRSYFGQKDGQQAIVVDQVARELGYNIAVVVVPTVRAPDGLALSSRNVHLSPEERAQAPALFRALQDARMLIEKGAREAAGIEVAVRAAIERAAPLARIDYVAIADMETLLPARVIRGPTLIALAVYFGDTRLIDNMAVRFTGDQPTFT